MKKRCFIVALMAVTVLSACDLLSETGNQNPGTEIVADDNTDTADSVNNDVLAKDNQTDVNDDTDSTDGIDSSVSEKKPDENNEVLDNTADSDEPENIEEIQTLPDKEYTSDYESQLELLADAYFLWEKDSVEDAYVQELYDIAITDLNRNGRLEIICSTIQGSGAFSNTFVYEVDEQFSGINKLSTTDYRGADWGGDFVEHDVINCYEKDGIYYYAMEDFTSSGWDLKEEWLYVYSFEDAINRETVGGYTLYPKDSDMELIYVEFLDNNKKNVESYEAFNQMLDDYWKDYEKQPCVEVKWVQLPEEEECLESLKESFNGYNENSDQTAVLLYDYQTIYGDTLEYKTRFEDLF